MVVDHLAHGTRALDPVPSARFARILRWYEYRSESRRKRRVFPRNMLQLLLEIGWRVAQKPRTRSLAILPRAIKRSGSLRARPLR